MRGFLVTNQVPSRPAPAHSLPVPLANSAPHACWPLTSAPAAPTSRLLQSTECTQPRFIESPLPEAEQRAGRRCFRNVSGGLKEDRPRGSDAWALAEGFVSVSFLSSMSAVFPPASVRAAASLVGKHKSEINLTVRLLF